MDQIQEIFRMYEVNTDYYFIDYLLLLLRISGQSGRVIPKQSGRCWGHGYKNGLCATGTRYETAGLWRGNGGKEETTDTKKGKEGRRNRRRRKGEHEEYDLCMINLNFVEIWSNNILSPLSQLSACPGCAAVDPQPSPGRRRRMWTGCWWPSTSGTLMGMDSSAGRSSSRWFHNGWFMHSLHSDWQNDR